MAINPQTGVRLPLDVRRQLKVLAAARDQTLAQLITDLVARESAAPCHCRARI